MTKAKIFLILSLSFIFGIFLASVFSLDVAVIYALVIVSVIIVSMGYRNKKTLVLGLAFFFLALGVWRTNASMEALNQANLDGLEIAENVIVAKAPEKKEGYQNIIAKISDGERILIRADINREINYGDEIDLACTLKIPENRTVISNEASNNASGISSGSLDNARDETTRFDYRMYLAKEKIYYLCQGAQFSQTGNNIGNGFYGGILKVAESLEQRIRRTIPEPQAALANGLLLGGSGRMSKDMQEKFSRTGMTHIVAVSGYNVTIIAEYLMIIGIFFGLWRKQAFWFAVVGIIFFVVMIGFPSSAVRAGVMGTLLLWAMKNGRLAHSWNAIIFAAAIMLAINPLLLRWDVGFQLSFLATIGIVALSPIWENYFTRKLRSLGLLEILFLTISAQIFVVPVILTNFGSFSLISLLANVLILPIVPLSMLFAFLTAFIGVFSYWLSLPFAWLAFLPLKYEIWVIEMLSQATWAGIQVERFDWLIGLCWYGLLFAVIIFIKKKINAKEKTRLWNFSDIARA